MPDDNIQNNANTDPTNNNGGEVSNDAQFQAFVEARPELKDKPYMENVKNFDDLFNWADNANSLIGKKTIGIPDENTSPEDLIKYYDSIRPASVDAYQFEDSELPESLKNLRNEELDTKVKELFHKAALRPDQAKMLKEGYDQLLLESHKDVLGQIEQANLNFDELSVKTFGKDADKVLESAKQIIKENKPEGFDDYLNSLPNESLVVMAGVINNIKNKYMKEDNLNNSNRNQSQETAEELRSERMKLLTDPAYKNKMDPRYPEIANRLKSIRTKLAEIQGIQI